jgi:ribosomal protein L7/L12
MSNSATPFIPPQVATVLAANRKIEAIKLVLDSNPGLGLRAAKDAVEGYQSNRQSAAVASSARSAAAKQSSGAGQVGDFPQAARQAIAAGNRILAIKIVREAYGLDLCSAMQRVDAYSEGLAPDADDDADAGRVSATANLPAEVVALILGGDRGRAAQLLEAKYGYSTRDAMTGIVAYELSRRRRGFGAAGGDTVRGGDNNGKMLVIAALIAIAAVAAWYFVAA